MHRKASPVALSIGVEVSCGSRKMKIDAVDGNVVDITLTIKKGETVEIRDPKQRDNPWILEDPGEGTMVESKHSVTIGHKIRVGNHRQFRIRVDGQIIVVGPVSEV